MTIGNLFLGIQLVIVMSTRIKKTIYTTFNIVMYCDIKYIEVMYSKIMHSEVIYREVMLNSQVIYTEVI